EVWSWEVVVLIANTPVYRRDAVTYGRESGQVQRWVRSTILRRSSFALTATSLPQWVQTEDFNAGFSRSEACVNAGRVAGWRPWGIIFTCASKDCSTCNILTCFFSGRWH